MSVVVDNYDVATYTLVLNSQDKISGNNNNATFQVNWKDFLPEEYDRYKMIFTFQTAGGTYADGAYPTYAYAGLSASTQISLVANSYVQNLPNFPFVAQQVTGVGIPIGTTLLSYNAPNLLLSQPALGTTTNSLICFWNTSFNNVNFSSARVVFRQVHGRLVTILQPKPLPPIWE